MFSTSSSMHGEKLAGCFNFYIVCVFNQGLTHRVKSPLVWGSLVRVCYKIMFGLVCVNPGEFFFTFSSVSQTRGHPYKLYKPRCTNTVRHNSFIGRVVNVWNALPTTVNFSSLLTFKSSLTNVDFSSYLKYAVWLFLFKFLFKFDFNVF